MKIICKKEFLGSNNQDYYGQRDIDIFNKCITDGIKELKNDWREHPDNKGIYLTEDENTLAIEVKIDEVDFENVHLSLEQIRRDMLTVINNYAIPYEIY